MSDDRYPLHAAERLRAAQRGQAEQALARALAECAAAQTEVEDVERALLGHAQRAPARVQGGVPGTIEVLELQREAAFARRNAGEARALREKLAAARARLTVSEVGLRAAQEALGRARGGEHAIERDHARFDAMQRRERERAEQAEVEERIQSSRKVE